MELRQLAKHEDMERRKVEDRRRKEREQAAGLRFNYSSPSYTTIGNVNIM